jgi:hypothetical protein
MKNTLLKIAREEILDGKTELLKAKLLNQREKIYLLTLQNERDGEIYHWKLLDLIVE